MSPWECVVSWLAEAAVLVFIIVWFSLAAFLCGAILRAAGKKRG